MRRPSAGSMKVRSRAAGSGPGSGRRTTGCSWRAGTWGGGGGFLTIGRGRGVAPDQGQAGPTSRPSREISVRAILTLLVLVVLAFVGYEYVYKGNAPPKSVDEAVQQARQAGGEAADAARNATQAAQQAAGPA